MHQRAHIEERARGFARRWLIEAMASSRLLRQIDGIQETLPRSWAGDAGQLGAFRQRKSGLCEESPGRL